MTTRQKQKRQDEMRQTTQTPIADAIAIGTAAGGLVLGTMQAQAATGEPDDRMEPLRDHLVSNQAKSGSATHEPVQPSEDENEPLSVEPAAQATEGTVSPVIDPVDMSTSIPLPVQEQLVLELSQQMAGTISKVIENVEPGMTGAEISQSISSDIIQAAQDIVAGIDIGRLLNDLQGSLKTTALQAEPAAIVDQVLGNASELVETVFTDIGVLPGEILGGTVGALSDLPSSLLGNEGPDGPGGLLSDLFYADGASDSLAIPELSSVASSLVTNGENMASGLLGVSYTDGPDTQGGHGLNALSLL